jgi:tetratricopeptide (TPR) repeat protein
VIDRRSAATYRGTTKSTQQIGTELGVRYLLEGVVRWAKDGAGVWRARVTPTLVDAKSGAIRWTGEPATVTLDDPFTAQGSIATDVAQAMEVAVLPAERVALNRRFTDNPQAYAAYQRAQSILGAAARTNTYTPDVGRRAIRDLEIAVSLDSTFAEAWGLFATIELEFATGQIGDSAIDVKSRSVLKRAIRFAPHNVGVILASASWALLFDQEKAKAESLIATALAASRNDAGALSRVGWLVYFWHPDSGRTLAVQAARLDPRSIASLEAAAALSRRLGRWDDAKRYGDAMIAIDSADERGWYQAINAALAAGDSIAIQRLSTVALRNVPKPGITVGCMLALGSAELSQWFLGLSAVQQRVTTRSDSVTYYDCKTDAALRIGGQVFSRAYSDSVISLFSRRRGRPPESFSEINYLLTLAFAYANVSDRTMAQSVMNRALVSADRLTENDSSAATFSSDQAAAVLAALGDSTGAVRWLRRGLRQGLSVGWYNMNPRLNALRSTNAFKELTRNSIH